MRPTRNKIRFSTSIPLAIDTTIENLCIPSVILWQVSLRVSIGTYMSFLIDTSVFPLDLVWLSLFASK